MMAGESRATYGTDGFYKPIPGYRRCPSCWRKWRTMRAHPLCSDCFIKSLKKEATNA